MGSSVRERPLGAVLPLVLHCSNVSQSFISFGLLPQANQNVPFIKRGVREALQENNFLAEARAFLIPKLQSVLDNTDDPDSVAELLARVIEDLLKSIGLVRAKDSVTALCYYFNKVSRTNEEVCCTSESSDCDNSNPPDTVEWSIPFGVTV